MANPHDTLFKETFSDPVHAAIQLRRLMPPALKERIDWQSLKLCPGSFPDPDGELRTDLLFICKLTGEDDADQSDAPCEARAKLSEDEPGKNRTEPSDDEERTEPSDNEVQIHLLFEHQSTPDPIMPLRLLSYQTSIWRNEYRIDPKKPLRPIISVVLHQGKNGWTTPTSVVELFSLSEKNAAIFGSYTPAFSWILQDLAKEDNVSLEPPNLDTDEVNVSMVLWLFRDGRDSKRFLEEIYFWAPYLDLTMLEPDGPAKVRRFFYYLLESNKTLSRKIIIDAIQAASPSTAKTMVSIAEGLIAEGLEKGLQKGLVQGLQKGQLTLLSKQLSLKFGSLSSNQEERLNQATQEDIDKWSERLFTAQSIEEVLS